LQKKSSSRQEIICTFSCPKIRFVHHPRQADDHVVTMPFKRSKKTPSKEKTAREVKQKQDKQRRARNKIFSELDLPRDIWLCYSDDSWGHMSVRYYFTKRQRKAACQTVRDMGQGKVTFKHDDEKVETLFRANRSQGYNGLWMAIGQTAPSHCVYDQLVNHNLIKSVASNNQLPAQPNHQARSIPSKSYDTPPRRSQEVVFNQLPLRPSQTTSIAPSTTSTAPSTADTLTRDKLLVLQPGRIGTTRVEAKQTALVCWSIDQTDALLAWANSLPKGSIIKTHHQPIGCAEILYATVKTPGRKQQVVKIASCELATGSRQMHCNARYVTATLTAPGFTPTSAQRSMSEIGFRNTPNLRNVLAQRLSIVETIRMFGLNSMQAARRRLYDQIQREDNLVEIGAQVVAAVTAHSDGFGAKRSYANYMTGEGAGAALMVGALVICAEFKQNNDVLFSRDRKNGRESPRPGYRNHIGSVATAEVGCMDSMVKQAAAGNIHIANLAVDGDAKSVKGLRKSQQAVGIPEENLAKPIAVICHEIKNLDKQLLKFANKNLPPSSHVNSSRVKAIGADVRRVIAACAAAIKDLSDEERDKVLSEFSARHIPQVINHHCGDCKQCDPKWCLHRKLIDKNNALAEPLDDSAVQALYFHKSRFYGFIEVLPSTMAALRGLLTRRYPPKALLALSPMLTNNNIERLWTRIVKFNQGKRLNTTQRGVAMANMMMAILENNDGYSWLDKLDKHLGLRSLASQTRKDREVKQTADKIRKRESEYRTTRKARKLEVDRNCGKKVKGFKGRYKPDSVPAGSIGAPKRKKRKLTPKKVCSKCRQKGHGPQHCKTPRFPTALKTTTGKIQQQYRVIDELLQWDPLKLKPSK